MHGFRPSGGGGNQCCGKPPIGSGGVTTSGAFAHPSKDSRRAAVKYVRHVAPPSFRCGDLHFIDHDAASANVFCHASRNRRQFVSIRHVVDARPAPGRAPGDAAQRQPSALDAAVLGQSLQRIGRAGGVIATVVADMRRKHRAVRVHRPGQNAGEGGQCRPRAAVPEWALSSARRRSARISAK